MPYASLTPLGSLETLIERTAPYAMDAAGVMVATQSDTGQPLSVSVVGDAAAAVTESFSALFDHLLASTNDPRVGTILLLAREQIGL